MSFSFSEVAASSYSGARALQWPHQGAKTAEAISYLVRCNACGVLKLTLGEDKLIALDEVVESVLGQLGDVGLALSCGEGGESCQKASCETFVLHDGLCCGNPNEAGNETTLQKGKEAQAV